MHTKRRIRFIPITLNRTRGIWLALACLIAGATGFSALHAPVSIGSDAYQGTVLNEPATDFRLVDQHGTQVALSDFRGRVVALTFMDSQCHETCPLTARQLWAAYQRLGSTAPVTFIGVNVNVQANRVADVAAITQQWQLDHLPAWHFVTGYKEALEPVWHAYHVAVAVPTDGGELMHTPGVYLIDQKGQLRWYVSTSFDETDTAAGMTPLNDLLVQHIQALLHDG